MKSIAVRMTHDEFERYHVPFGWKAEYIGGRAYLEPYRSAILMKRPVVPMAGAAKVDGVLLPAEPNQAGLDALFYRAFVDTVEYCNCPKQDIKQAAGRAVGGYFAGRRGIPQPGLSRVMVLPGKRGRAVGACLVSKYKYGYRVALLFVDPHYHRNGIATALAAAVVNGLHGLGEDLLWSECFAANEASRAWHGQSGFVEEPDIMTARLRFLYYRREVRRQQLLGNRQGAAALAPLLAQADAEVGRLSAIEREDVDAAWLRWRDDF